ncbi:MAG: type II toxin-antitoxin system HicA family toxin [Candidatus Acidiferrales bacterium]
MPRLPGVKPREVIQFLAESGFVLDHVSGSHFVYYHPTSKRRAVVPRHNRDIPKGTLLSLLREAGFSREQLIRFLEGSYATATRQLREPWNRAEIQRLRKRKAASSRRTPKGRQNGSKVQCEDCYA